MLRLDLGHAGVAHGELLQASRLGQHAPIRLIRYRQLSRNKSCTGMRASIVDDRWSGRGNTWRRSGYDANRVQSGQIERPTRLDSDTQVTSMNGLKATRRLKSANQVDLRMRISISGIEN